MTQHGQTPNTGVMLNQTESLIIRIQGDYIENKGTLPDKAYNTFEDLSSGYYSTISEAKNYLMSL